MPLTQDQFCSCSSDVLSSNHTAPSTPAPSAGFLSVCLSAPTLQFIRFKIKSLRFVRPPAPLTMWCRFMIHLMCVRGGDLRDFLQTSGSTFREPSWWLIPGLVLMAVVSISRSDAHSKQSMFYILPGNPGKNNTACWRMTTLVIITYYTQRGGSVMGIIRGDLSKVFTARINHALWITRFQ